MGCCRPGSEQALKQVIKGEGGPHREIAAADGLTLHIVTSGDGPPVIMLHGFTGSADTWKHLRQKLDGTYRVIAIDQPGHGRSSAPADPQRYRLGRFATDLCNVLDSLEIERTVVLGYSMGGRAALRFALDHPDRLAGLVLESTSPGIPDSRQRSERRAADAALADGIERDGIERFVKRWEALTLWDSQRALPDLGNLLRLQRLSNTPHGLANSLRGAGTAEAESVLAAAAGIKAPTLLIAGGLDSKYVELGRQLAKSIPHSRLEIVPNAGHAVHLERAHGYAHAITTFLSTIPSAEGRWT